jgi:hypothetical protein
MPSFLYFSNLKIKNEYKSFHRRFSCRSSYNFIGSNSYVSWGITNGLAHTAHILRIKIEKSRVDSNYIINLEDTNK